MIGFIQNIASCVILLVLSHEGGHYLSAFALKLHPKLNFELSWWPFFVSYDETIDRNYRIVATMGFGGSHLAGIALLALLGTAGAWIDKNFLLTFYILFSLHFISYPFRQKGKVGNDFNKMDADEDASH